MGEIFARLNVDAMLPTLEEAIEEWRPDLIVREASEFASAIAADLHGVRHMRVAIGISFVEVGGTRLRGAGARRAASGRRRADRGVAVPHVLPAIGRPAAVPRHPAPASGRRCARRAAAGLVARRRAAARLRELRQRGRHVSAGGAGVREAPRRRRGAACPRAAHNGRARGRARRRAGQRPRRALGLRARRPRACIRDGGTRRLGHDPERDRRGLSARQSCRCSATSR